MVRLCWNDFEVSVLDEYIVKLIVKFKYHTYAGMQLDEDCYLTSVSTYDNTF